MMTLEPLFDRLTESHVPGVSRVGHVAFNMTDRLLDLIDRQPLVITTQKRIGQRTKNAFDLGRDVERQAYTLAPVEPQRRRGHLHLVV